MTTKIASVTSRNEIDIWRLPKSAKAILLNAPMTDNNVGIIIGMNMRGSTNSLYLKFAEIVANRVPTKLIPNVAITVTKMV